MKNPQKRGFTLLEILVVVAVIMLLTGMLFRVGSLVSDRSARARAIADMQAIANALEEYYAVYGMYPPTSGMRYEYAVESLQPPQMAGIPSTNVTHGLVFYLFRHTDESLDDRRNDASEAVKERWQHYLADLNAPRWTERRQMEPGEGFLNYSNRVLSVRTPWDGDYDYESRAPYLSYRLWTRPPNSEEDLSVSSAGQ